MILGVLPFFVLNDLGATKALLGLMEGTGESLNYFLRTFSGVISDRVARRKPLVFIGYALSTVSKPFFSVATNFTDALAVRLADRAGKGIRTSPRDALISDSVKDAQSGRAFGLHRSMDQIGAILGPVLAYFLLPLPFVGTRGLFLVSLVPGAIAVLVLTLFVVDKKGLKKQRDVLKNARAVLDRKFSGYLLVIGIFSLGAYNFSFVLVKAGALGVDPGTIPLVYAFLNSATVVAGLPSGLLADRFGKDKALLLALGFFALSSLAGILTTTGVLVAFAIAFVYGLYLGTSDTIQRAFIPFLSPAEFKGTAYAVYYLLLAVCSLVANLVFGALWDQVSASAAFTYSLVTAVVAIAGFLFLTASWKRDQQSGPLMVSSS